MQHRIRAVLHRLGAYFARRGSQQREQFGRLASHVLVGPTCGPPFRLPGRAARRSDTPAQLPFFSLRIRIVALFHATLSLVERGADLTPGAVLLPGVACFMDAMQDGEGADLWQPIGSLAQGALQGGERPGGRSICLEQGTPSQFVPDARALRRAIAARMAAPR